jgi:hypothetical protein
VALADSGRVSYLGFDCLAERTMALAQIRKMRNPAAGQDQRIAAMVPALAGFIRRGGRVIGNFGAANPDAAELEFAEGLRAIGLSGVRIGVIRGDDVLDLVKQLDVDLPELKTTAAALGTRLISANAYVGADKIVECLRDDAQLIIGGRLADPSLFVGPICYEMGWDLDDWDRVAAATLVGHMLECGVHSTGGNFEDPPYRLVPDPHNLGFPMAEIDGDQVIVTKLEGTGGAVDTRTTRTQLYYEIHDPTAYLTPDVTADFSRVLIEEVGPDRVRLSGAIGTQRPDNLKVLVGVDLGWKSVGEISYGGPGCVERAERAAEIVRRRLAPYDGAIDELRVDLQGVSSLHAGAIQAGYPAEVRLRIASRTRNHDAAIAAAHEVELLYFGPAGGGGVVTSVVPAIAVTPAYVPRELVKMDSSVVTS